MNKQSQYFEKSLGMNLEDSTLPTEVTEHNGCAFKHQASLQGLRALIVEDDVDTRDLFGLVIQEAGAEVIGAASASEAISTARNWYPDLLICDIHLPDEDGYTLLHKIRLLEAEVGKQILAIAITAGRFKEENCLQTLSRGFQEYLLKPIDLDQFLILLTELAECSHQPQQLAV
jgi:two-component system, OmpR family, response regulator